MQPKVILNRHYGYGGETCLECDNLADLMYLINSFDFTLIDEDEGILIVDEEWYMEFGPVILGFADGCFAIAHFLREMGWEFGLGETVRLGPHDWKWEDTDTKRAIAWLARENFEDRINWHFGRTDKFMDRGWLDVKITSGDPFSWISGVPAREPGCAEPPARTYTAIFMSKAQPKEDSNGHRQNP